MSFILFLTTIVFVIGLAVLATWGEDDDDYLPG